jgi:hypothetical protein
VEAQGKITCNGFVSKPKWWPDYVFESSYQLITLDSVKNYIKMHGHLPGFPSAQTFVLDGQDVPYIQLLQQQKIEELTLYIIEQNGKIKLLEEEYELICKQIRTKNSNKK